MKNGKKCSVFYELAGKQIEKNTEKTEQLLYYKCCLAGAVDTSEEYTCTKVKHRRFTTVPGWGTDGKVSHRMTANYISLV